MRLSGTMALVAMQAPLKSFPVTLPDVLLVLRAEPLLEPVGDNTNNKSPPNSSGNIEDCHLF